MPDISHQNPQQDENPVFMNLSKDKDKALKEPNNKVIRKASEQKTVAPKDDEPGTAVDKFKNRQRLRVPGGLRTMPKGSKDNSKKSFSQSINVSARKCIPEEFDMESLAENSYRESATDLEDQPKLTVGSLARAGLPTPNGFDYPPSYLKTSIQDLGAETQMGTNSVFSEIIAQQDR